MANEILYQCSNCGKAEQTRATLCVPDGMFYAGYRAHGDVLYCPDCVKTWKERNGAEYDEQYKDPHHLFAMWWNKQVQKPAWREHKIGVSEHLALIEENKRLRAEIAELREREKEKDTWTKRPLPATEKVE